MPIQKDLKGFESLFMNDNFGFNRDLFIVSTASGRIIYMSGALKLYIESDFTGRNLNDFLDDSIVAAIISKAHAGESFGFDCNISSKSFRCCSEPSDAGNVVVELFPINADAPSEIDGYTADMMTNEIGKLLAVMFSAMDIVKKDEEKQAMALAVINKSMYKMLKITRNVRDAVRFKTGTLDFNPSKGDLADFCKQRLEQAREYIEKTGINLTVEIADQAMPCTFDKEKISRIITNMLSNAVLASQSGEEMRFTISEKDSGYLISVSNRNSGLGADVAKRIFAQGKESLQNESGLSTTIIRALAQMHGGSFVIIANQNKSWTICVTLPKNEGIEANVLNSVRIDYSGSFDDILVDFSNILDSEFYTV